MIQLNLVEGEKYLEIGPGSHPKVRAGIDVRIDIRMCHNEQGEQTVDFVADLNEPLQLQSNEFDGVFSQFAFEHVSWRRLPQLLSECNRVLKDNGKIVLVLPNTEQQIQWIKDNPQGWDGKDSFNSFSCVLFGDQDYPDNTHKCYLNPEIIINLLDKAGFHNTQVHPYGERKTDMVVISNKAPKMQNATLLEHMVNSVKTSPNSIEVPQRQKPPTHNTKSVLEGIPREILFGKDYFNGGKLFGGYAREGYRDFPVHQVTVDHILKRKPKSVLEVGCSRGYILKRLQDKGIPGCGIEISKHCYMTRACEGIFNFDICNFPWPLQDKQVDLAYSIAVLEHIPQEFIPGVINEMKRVSKRQLHGIDFGHNDDGFDKTHCSLFPKEKWIEWFGEGDIEVVDKEELERGEFPGNINDNYVKLNIGSFTTMFYDGWWNIDVHNLEQYAQQNFYKYLKHDVTTGIPFHTGSVDCIFNSHMLEHLSFKQAKNFLMDCRRVLNPKTGYMRILVPDARLLCDMYANAPHELLQYEEINDNVNKNNTHAENFHNLLYEGHQAVYDFDSLTKLLKQCNFSYAEPITFRNTEKEMGQKVLRETVDMFPCLSLIVEACP